MMKRFLIVALVVVLITTAVAYVSISWYFSNQIIARPVHELASSAERLDGPANYGLPMPEEIAVGEDGFTVRGWYFDNPVDGGCAVVILHGHTSNRYGALQYSPLFWERGCDLVMYDARGHGASDEALHTFGYYEKEDLAEVVGWTSSRLNMGEENIGVVGVSYGRRHRFRPRHSCQMWRLC